MRLIILTKEFGVDLLTKIQLTSLLGLVCFWLLIAARSDAKVDDKFKYVVFTVLGFLLSLFASLITTVWQVWAS